MGGEEESKYVSQLKDMYDSCDTTGTGYLDKEELTELCHKLHLERQLPLLLETLLGNNHFARVNFDEFKEGFVTVLSSSISLGLSDDDSSYLEPAVPDEVAPKYINGAKWYGRRTRPELQSTKLETTKYLQEQQSKSQLRRSASLESVESLKSDEEPESAKEAQHELFEGEGQMCTWDDDLYDGPRKVSISYFDMTENQVRDIWEDLGIGNNGYLNKQELATVCKNIGLKELGKEDLEELFNKLDSDGDGQVSLKEFQLGLFSHNRIPCPVSSTPLKPKCQRSTSFQIFKCSGHRSATPSFFSGSVALNLFSSIDDGSGFASPEQVISIWAQEGVENCKELLKSLDFNMEERVNLLELSAALSDELMALKSQLQQAAFATFKHELHNLQVRVEQISTERDKARLELEKVEKWNLQLSKEVDDSHSALEHHNESKLRDLEQDYRGKLTVMKSEVETEREQYLHQAYHQRTKLEAEIKSLKEEESNWREKLTLVIKENGRLQNEVAEMVQKLAESEKQALKFQKDLDFLLKDKLGLLDPHNTEFFDQEERFADIIKEYELQCRDLRDKNDELQMEMEKLCSQLHGSQHSHAKSKMKAKSLEERLLPENVKSGIPGVNFTESDPYSVSIQMELLVEELKEQCQDLKIQLETKVNYYEREIELMKRNFEEERKDIEQGFKIEISELEEQKNDLEELNAKCQEVMDGLKAQLQKRIPLQELKKSFEKERSEMEQYYAKEISNLGQRLAQERDRLEDDMKKKHEIEMDLMRIQLATVSEDNTLLKNKLGISQQEVEVACEANTNHRKEIDELKMEREKAMCKIEELNQLNNHYKEEIFQLKVGSNQLSHEVSEQSSYNKANRKTIAELKQRFAELERQKAHETLVAKQLQEASAELTKEHLQLQLAWQGEQARMEQELKASREKSKRLQELESELERLTQECQVLRLAKAQLTDEAEEYQDQLLEANTRLSLAESRHAEELQQLRSQMDGFVPKDCLAEVENRLTEEQKRIRLLEGEFNFQAEQMSQQLSIYREEHKNSKRLMEEKARELEMNLKNEQLLLQEKMAQLKEQLEKNAKSNLLLKDLYVENAQLMKTLQVAEQRQRNTENRNLVLEEKIISLNNLIGEITLASQ
uniref:Ninein-like protein n=1 Tax=Anolis carolinensis TaxID=28377 RepID=L7N013_ANOCA|nr:PREDICTED: ninein-like protein isoform X1 [Anolis carolinensis]|eukprot:XP_003216150.1 PREDICTED: ninein-like protein isoform X1 [Anolis carolinensis]